MITEGTSLHAANECRVPACLPEASMQTAPALQDSALAGCWCRLHGTVKVSLFRARTQDVLLQER